MKEADCLLVRDDCIYMQKHIYVLISKVKSWTTKYVTPNMSIVNFIDPQFCQYAISLPFCQTRVARSSLNDLIPDFDAGYKRTL